MTETKRKDRKGKKKGGKKGDSTAAAAPKLKPMKNPITVDEGGKLIVKCEAKGSSLSFRWFKDGNELKKSKTLKIRVTSRKSKLQINRAKLEDSGNYTCVVENALGKDNSTGTVNVQSSEYYLSNTWHKMYIQTILPALSGRWSVSACDRTRKMVNYAWAGRSQRKLWWRPVAVLTCKSVVRPG
ncbi:hypothetical protein JOQ06_019334, partial [Pogonophryne albipinna]